MHNNPELLFEAVEKNDLTMVSEVLDTNPELIAAVSTMYSGSILGAAESAEMVNLLLSRGAKVDASGDENWQPIHLAENAEVANALICAGADVNARTDADITPLHTRTYHSEVIQVLLDNGADVNARDCLGMTPLHNACEEDCISVDEYLCMNNLEWDEIGRITIPVERTNWPIQLDVAKRLIAHGANVNAQDHNGWTPLHLAVETDFVDMVELLLKNGADPTLKTVTKANVHLREYRAGMTAVDMAKELERYKIRKLFDH